jgi:hypothetical protein
MGGKTAWFLVLCLAMVLLLGASVIASEQNDAGSGRDASNEREGAYLLTPGTFTGFLGDDDDEDWYEIYLGRGAIVSVNLAVPETANFDLYLDPSGQQTIVRSTYGAGQDEAIHQCAVGQEAGTCYIRVVLRDGKGEYQLTLGVENQNDAGSGQDVSNEREGAYPLTPGTYSGFLKHFDDVDYYEIEIMKGQILSINLTVPETADFDLFPASYYYYDMPEDPGTGQDEAIQFVPRQSWPRYIRVFRDSGEGEYQLTIEVQNQNDAGSGQDVSNEKGRAYPLTLGPLAGFLMASDNADWYKIDREEGQLLSIDFAVPETATFDLSLYRPHGWPGLRGGGRYSGGTHDKAIHHVAWQSGTWHILVGRHDGEGEYTLTVRGGGHEGDPLSPRLPEPDGVVVPLPRSNPDLASGSGCRGACGSGCPDTCEPQSDMVVYMPDPDNDESYYRISYAGVIRCGTHEGCRWHDWCFDECAKRFDETGDYAVLDDCHLRCSNTVRKRYDDWDAINWALGNGPYDGYLLFSDPPIWEGPFSGSPDLVTYYIVVTTGDKWFAGTDASVFITLFGTDGRTSGEIHLDNPDKNDFESEKNSFFLIEEKETVGDIDHIRIRHDNTGDFAGWYLEKVSVMNMDTSEEWVFTANRWLDEDDGLSAEFSPD